MSEHEKDENKFGNKEEGENKSNGNEEGTPHSPKLEPNHYSQFRVILKTPPLGRGVLHLLQGTQHIISPVNKVLDLRIKPFPFFAVGDRGVI